MHLVRCAITDGTAGTRPAWLVERCATLSAAGVELFIVREPELDSPALAAIARSIVAAAPASRVLVAGPTRLALAAGAAGVHLSARPDEQTPAGVRAHMPDALITQSCHTLPEVERAREQKVDAVLFGPVFGKWAGGEQVVRGTGLELLEQAVATAGETPVYALGGITETNASLCRCAGIAAIRLFFSHDVSTAEPSFPHKSLSS